MARITSLGKIVGEPFEFKKYLHQLSDMLRYVLMFRNKDFLPEFVRADTWFPLHLKLRRVLKFFKFG